jgi:hypothetical protein
MLLRLADQPPTNVLEVQERLLTHDDLDDLLGCVIVVTERLVWVRRSEAR